MWMKTDFDFGMDTVCVLVAAAQFRHTTVGKLSHLNPSEEKKKNTTLIQPMRDLDRFAALGSNC